MSINSDAPPPEETTLRQRLRTLIQGGVLPGVHSSRLWAGRCRVKHGCTICGASIEVGETEFEFTSSGIKLFVHGRCFDFWIKGAAASLDDGNRAQGHPRSS